MVTVGIGPVTADEFTDVGTTICPLTNRRRGRVISRVSSIVVEYKFERCLGEAGAND
jgi:hypothetical protein